MNHKSNSLIPPTRRDLFAQKRYSNKVWVQVKVCLSTLAVGRYGVDDALDEIMEIIETNPQNKSFIC